MKTLFKKMITIFVFVLTIVSLIGVSGKKYIIKVIGAGDSESNPVEVFTYAGLKAAIENSSSSYIKLANANEELNINEDSPVTTINVNRNITLIVNGANTFTDLGTSPSHLDSLFTVNNGEFVIKGSGSIKLNSFLTNGFNAVVKNNGGSVTVDGATIEGSYNPKVYGRAIFQLSGNLFIKSGRFIGVNTNDDNAGIAAVNINGGTFKITGGVFEGKEAGTANDHVYGLDIKANATGNILNGKFDGIKAEKSLNTYISAGYKMFVGTMEMPDAVKDTTDEVEVNMVINAVETVVASPVGGSKPQVKTPNPASDGYYFTDISWYLGSTLIPASQAFEAGQKYTVKLTAVAKDGYRFAKESNLSAEVNGIGGNVVNRSGDGKQFTVSYTFDAAKTLINSIAASFTSNSDLPLGTVMEGDSIISFDCVIDNPNVTGVLLWYKCDTIAEANNSNYTGGAGKFIPDVNYVAIIRFNTTNGAEFDSANMGIVTINGVQAELVKKSNTQVDYGIVLQCTKKVNVVYDGDGATKVIPTASIVPGMYKIVDTVPNKDKCKFKCWSVNGQEKNPGDTIEVTEDIVLRAVWYKYIQQVHINVSQFEIGTDTAEVEVSVDEENLSADVYSWEVDPGTFEDDTYTLYVKVSVNQEDELFAAGGNKEISINEFKCNNKIAYFADTEIDEDQKSFIYTYTAKAAKTTVLVTYNGYEETDVEEVRVKIGENFNLPNPSDLNFVTPLGYNFTGWNVNDVTKQVGDEISLTIDTVISAMYEEASHDCAKFLTKHSGSSATCTTDGAKDYYECSECNKYYEDDQAQNQIYESVDDWKVIPASHDLKTVTRTEATCSQTGNILHQKCEVCNSLFDGEGNPLTLEAVKIDINPTAHKFGNWVEEVSATENTNGVKAHKDCDLCHKHFDKDENEIADLTIKATNPSNPGSSDDKPTNPKPEKSNAGAVVGISIAVVVVLVVAAYFVGGFVFFKKGKLTGKFFETIYKWIK